MKPPQHERILLADALVRYKLRGRLARCQAIRCVLRTISVRSGSLKITACGLDPRAGATPVCTALEPPQTCFVPTVTPGVALALEELPSVMHSSSDENLPVPRPG